MTVVFDFIFEFQIYTRLEPLQKQVFVRKPYKSKPVKKTQNYTEVELSYKLFVGTYLQIVEWGARLKSEPFFHFKNERGIKDYNISSS